MAVALTAFGWIWAAREKAKTAAFIAAWLLLHSFLAIREVYADFEGVPNVFFAVFATAIVVGVLAFSNYAKPWRDSLNPEVLTYMHTIRVEVELVLYGLYAAGWASVAQTFAGSNFDILIGLTAPIIAYLFFRGQALSARMFWWWNVGGILLLGNIVAISFASAPHQFQQMSFEQPARAFFYFPFNLLPLFVVPSMFAIHFIILKRLKLN